jgi:hypothetical protein
MTFRIVTIVHSLELCVTYRHITLMQYVEIMAACTINPAAYLIECTREDLEVQTGFGANPASYPMGTGSKVART